MRVLIAEDDAVSRLALAKAVSNWGYEVVAVEDGHVAREILLRRDPPELAILDWMMPGPSGVELCKAVRQGERGSYTYILLLTAKTEPQELAEALDSGADDFIRKPFNPLELRARILAGVRIVELQQSNRAALQSIRASEHRYRELFENARDTIFVTDADARIVALNHTGETILRYAQADLLGTPFASLVEETDREKLMLSLGSARHSGRAFAELDIRTGAASVLTLDVSVRPLFEMGALSGFELAARDCTKEKQTRHALRRSERRFNHLARAGLVGLFCANRDGEITFANGALLRMLRYTRDEWSAAALRWDFFAGAAGDAHSTDSQLEHYGVCPPYRKDVTAGDGTLVSLMIGAAAFEEEGEILAFVLDVTGHDKHDAEAPGNIGND